MKKPTRENTPRNDFYGDLSGSERKNLG